MKYSTFVNLAGIHDAGFSEKTDLIDWCLLDYIRDWLNEENSTKMEGHVWINHKTLMKDIPILNFKTKSAVSKRLTKLVELGLLSKKTESTGYERRSYYKTTQLYQNTVV